MSIARQYYRNALEVFNLRKQGRDDGLEYKSRQIILSALFPK